MSESRGPLDPRGVYFSIWRTYDGRSANRPQSGRADGLHHKIYPLINLIRQKARPANFSAKNIKIK